MLTAEQINIIGDKYIASLYEDMEREVIADVARRVKKTSTYTETAELMAKAMREQGFSTARIQKEALQMLGADKEYARQVAENTKAYKHEVKGIIKDVVKKGKAAGDAIIGNAGRMAWNEDLRVWAAQGINLSKPSSLSQLIEAFARQTNGELRNMTQSTGFKGTKLGTVGIMNAYQRSMDMAVLKISSGVFSQQEAIDDVVHQLSQSGLRTIDYASGRSFSLEAAAKMCIRTGCSQLAGKITEMNINKTGVELVYVDAHAGARPSHQDWQGQVYSWDGKSTKYPNFYFATNYGDADGLKGINCTHNFYPYWEGLPLPEWQEHPDVIYNGEQHSYYEGTQELRKQERAIRATKREIDAKKAIGEDTSDLKAKLSTQNQKYKHFKENLEINVVKS